RLSTPGSVPEGTRATLQRPETRTGPEGPVAWSGCPRPSALRDAHHLGGHEDQQLGFFPVAATILEQVAEDRDVTQERNLGQITAVAERVDTTDRHCLSGFDQHRGGDPALVDPRDRAQARPHRSTPAEP